MSSIVMPYGLVRTLTCVLLYRCAFISTVKQSNAEPPESSVTTCQNFRSHNQRLLFFAISHIVFIIEMFVKLQILGGNFILLTF
jgi:hypothetical protein